MLRRKKRGHYRQRQCQHLRATAIYGDEINWAGGKRGHCPTCGLWLDYIPLSFYGDGDYQLRGDYEKARSHITGG